ncbi:uncharacterized protein LOC116841922 isoform X2 [Odontomachus brunneus]|uniref:uncharacterized protein LOC116841922 isoform X2 n=1 Tax=Odontomachus brunneus TaxID=486640 RepID=UPI0013F1C590|nr:uncharacterized protein LOC116841922 isoform X2 [Odontomachus brunneus]
MQMPYRRIRFGPSMVGSKICKLNVADLELRHFDVFIQCQAGLCHAHHRLRVICCSSTQSKHLESSRQSNLPLCLTDFSGCYHSVPSRRATHTLRTACVSALSIVPLERLNYFVESFKKISLVGIAIFITRVLSIKPYLRECQCQCQYHNGAAKILGRETRTRDAEKQAAIHRIFRASYQLF